MEIGQMLGTYEEADLFSLKASESSLKFFLEQEVADLVLAVLYEKTRFPTLTNAEKAGAEIAE